jgi:hypothetical protein
VRPDFYVPNGKPKVLWLRELRRDARQLACATPLNGCPQKRNAPPPIQMPPKLSSSSLYDFKTKSPAGA